MNGGSCELYTDCHAVVEVHGFMMYVRNSHNIQPHVLPAMHENGRSGTFMVTGDWGGATSGGDRPSMHYVRNEAHGSEAWNRDHYAQDNVARRMGELADQRHPFMVVNAGDNFYWGGINHWTRGGHGVHDHFWSTGFENMYTHPSLNVPWISIMGNHDYGGVGCFSDMKAQFDFTTKDLLRFSRWKMPSPYYSHQVDFDGLSLIQILRMLVLVRGVAEYANSIYVEEEQQQTLMSVWTGLKTSSMRRSNGLGKPWRLPQRGGRSSLVITSQPEVMQTGCALCLHSTMSSWWLAVTLMRWHSSIITLTLADLCLLWVPEEEPKQILVVVGLCIVVACMDFQKSKSIMTRLVSESMK